MGQKDDLARQSKIQMMDSMGKLFQNSILKRNWNAAWTCGKREEKLDTQCPSFAHPCDSLVKTEHVARFIGSQADIKRPSSGFALPYVPEEQLAEAVAGEIGLRLAFCEKATELSRLTRCAPVARTEWYVIDSKERAAAILYGSKRFSCSTIRLRPLLLANVLVRGCRGTVCFNYYQFLDEGYCSRNCS